MKVIKLLNMISKGEEAPEKIKYNGKIFELDDYGHYMHEENVGFIFEYTDLFDETLNYDLDFFLNDEIELIEDEFIDIEELDISDRRKREDCNPLTVEIMAKINELIKNQKAIINKIKDSE